MSESIKGVFSNLSFIQNKIRNGLVINVTNKLAFSRKTVNATHDKKYYFLEHDMINHGYLHQ